MIAGGKNRACRKRPLGQVAIPITHMVPAQIRGLVAGVVKLDPVREVPIGICDGALIVGHDLVDYHGH